MNRRTKTIITIIIILLVILAILLFWFRFRGDNGSTAVVVVEDTGVTEDSGSNVPPIAQIPEDEPRKQTEVTIETLTKTFAERYGSYSNESEFANIDDLETLMTSRLQAEMASMVASAQLNDVYHGITTRVISMNVLELDELGGMSTVSVLTQREEAIGSPLNAEVRYQTLILELVKYAGMWKVDVATWE